MKKNGGKIKHKITYVDDIKFDSKMESKYYIYAKELKEQGVIKNIKLQPTFLLQEKFILLNGQAIFGSDPDFDKLKRKHKLKTYSSIEYTPDFELEYADGTIKLIETKGKSTPDFELKKRLFLCNYPDRIIEVLILNEKTKEWVDYYEYNKELRAKKREKNKAKAELELQGGR